MVYFLAVDPLEEGETIYEAAFKEKENRNPDDKYPSFHKVDLLKKEENAKPLSSKKSQQKSKKHHKTQKPSPLEGIEDKISKVYGLLKFCSELFQGLKKFQSCIICVIRQT